MKKGYILVVLVLSLLIAGCSSNTQNNNPSPATTGNNIEINNFAFSPSELTINQGDTVTWTNKDSVKHSITSDSGSELGSSLLSTSETFSHTFNTVGTYNYHCSAHPSMTAKIIVQ